MAFIPLYGFETNTTAITAANSGQIQIDPNVANQLAITLGANYSYASISDGVNYELIRINSVNSPNLIVTRAQGGTTSSAFPQGACIRFVWTQDGIIATAGTSNLVLTGAGALAATQTGPNAWTLNVPVPVITDAAPIQVLGSYPAWEIAIAQSAGNCCCGSSSGGGGGDVTITGTGIINVTGTSPNFVIGALATNLIAGSGISIIGSYPNFTISATGGGGGGVTSITGSAKILISGAPTTPTISLNTTGVGAGTYNGITYDIYGTITAVNSGYVPITVLNSVTSAITVTPVSAGHLQIDSVYANTTQVGVVVLAAPTAAASNNAGDSTSAVTPAGVNAVISAIGVTTVSGSSTYSGSAPSSYTNILSSTTVTLNLTGTQKALVVATVQVQDATNPLPPWGFAVFNGATFVQGLQPSSTGSQKIEFIVNAPLGPTVFGIATTTLAGTTSVIGQSIYATITPQ